MDEEEKMRAGREKYWVELTDSEKIERMRNHVKSLEKTVRYLRGQMEKMRHHRHDGTEILVPFDSRDPQGESLGRHEDSATTTF